MNAAAPALEFDHTLRSVVLGTGAIGAVSGALGSFAYLRRQSLVGDVVAHSSLLGIVGAFLLGYLLTGTGSRSLWVLVPGAVAAGVAALLLSRAVTSRTRLSEDAGLGVMLALFFGGGVLLLRWAQRHQPVIPGHTGLDAYLFGSAAALTTTDLWMISSVGLAALFVMLLLWRRLEVYTFDPLFAHSLGIPVRRLEAVLRVLLVTGVVVGIHAVGVVLMIALLATPASAARQWTRHLGTMVALSSLFGAVSAALGTVISARYAHLPAGPVIVLVATAVFLVSLACAPRRGLLSRMRRRVRSVEVAGA
ncbi:MAG: metal ABC transporter permease [Planctomycetes bacterium]|nr:metal ABC transporter permease [Planctomycetota bacterium]